MPADPIMKFLYHLVLAVLLLASLAAGTVAAVWRWAPERVEDYDVTIVQRYEQEPQDEVNRLKALAEVARATALPQIRTLVKELEPYQGTDRRLPARLDANRLLIATLLEDGQTEEGLSLARQFAGLNPFDHSTRRWVASQFVQAGKPYAQEGLAMLASLFETFPEDPALARTLAFALKNTGDQARAVDVALAHLESIPTEAKAFEQMNRPWLYSATARKEDLATTNSGSLDPIEGLSHLIFAVNVPMDARFLRLTAPIRPQAAFGPPVASIAFERNMDYVGLLVDLPTDVKNATLDPQGLVLDGGLRPSITVELPEHKPQEASSEGNTEEPNAEVAKSGETEPNARPKTRLVRIGLPTNRFPRWVEDYLVTEEAAPKVAAIRASAGESLRARFFAERVSITRAYAMAFRGPSFRVEGQDSTIIPSVVHDSRKLSDGPTSDSPYDMTFAGEVTLEGDARTVNVEIPAVVGAVVQVERADWIDAGQADFAAQASAAEITSVDPLQLVAVPGSTNTWRVLPGATQPTLRISRPQASGLTCQLKGGLR